MPPAAGESAALSRDLADFLIELSIALHKNAIYPGGHPLLETAVGGVERRLAALLTERPTLSLGVARHQLVIEGVATDGKHPLLRELANRLHRHHLGAVRFHQGVTRVELADFLRVTAEDATRAGAQPIGLQPQEVDRWQHVRLFPLTYEQLQLLEEDELPEEPAPDELLEKEPEGIETDAPVVVTGALGSGQGFGRQASGGAHGGAGGTGSRSAQLWIGLARAAMAAEHEAETPEGAEGAEDHAHDPVAVAKAIDEHGGKDQAYDQVIVGYLLQIAQELKDKRGREAQGLQRRISRLVAELSPATLRRLLEMGGDLGQRRRFVLDAAQGMTVEAVVDLVQAAAETSQQTISHSMLRLLSKFAVHAEGGVGKVRPEFDSALREQVQQLMSGWRLADPNPDGYRLALEGMSRAAPLFDAPRQAFPPEPERMLQMALEVGGSGDALWRAVDDLVAKGRFSVMFDLLERSPATHVAGRVWERVVTPDRLRELTQQDTLPMPIVERMARHLGFAAVEPLLDAYEAERHMKPVAELLPALGDDAAELVIVRMEGARAQALRAWLQLLQRFERLPAGWSARGLLRVHADPEVRREAFKLEARDAARRDDAIVLALNDSDDRVVRAALSAALAACPPAAVPSLMRKADDEELADDVRVGCVRVLAQVLDDGVRDWLVSRVTTRAGVLRRVRLAPRTPVRLAALQALGATWGADPQAREALELARQSADPEVRAAITSRARRTTGTGMMAIPEPHTLA